MRLGIMQPYFFPYLGYFSLIAETDRWVVFDLTQYTPKTWMNRNRVLHPSSGWSWVTVPLANGSRSIRIHEARVASMEAAHRSVLGKLSHYRNKAPHWRAVEAIVDEVFRASGDDSLTRLDLRAMASVCAYLSLRFEAVVASDLELDLPPIGHPGGWAPEIAHALGADSYLNPIGGQALFRPEEFDALGIELCFLEPPALAYDTSPYGFEPAMSILDVLMWNDPAEARRAVAGGTVHRATSHPNAPAGASR